MKLGNGTGEFKGAVSKMLSLIFGLSVFEDPGISCAQCQP